MDEQQKQEIAQEAPRQKALAFKVIAGVGAVLMLFAVVGAIGYVALAARIEAPLSQMAVPERIFVV